MELAPPKKVLCFSDTQSIVDDSMATLAASRPKWFVIRRHNMIQNFRASFCNEESVRETKNTSESVENWPGKKKEVDRKQEGNSVRSETNGPKF